MEQLSLILFVADQIAADREFEGIAALRELAGEDLERAAFRVAANKLRYVILKERVIETQTVAVYHDLLAKARADEG